jgi:hypothetical protein
VEIFISLDEPSQADVPDIRCVVQQVRRSHENVEASGHDAVQDAADPQMCPREARRVVTVVYDSDRKPCRGRPRRPRTVHAGGLLLGHPVRALQSLESISMGMWSPYIEATRLHVPTPPKDRVGVGSRCQAHRRWRQQVHVEEHAELRKSGDAQLVGTRPLWLQSREHMKPSNRPRFTRLRNTSLRVARAWAMKETARGCDRIGHAAGRDAVGSD